MIEPAIIQKRVSKRLIVKFSHSITLSSVQNDLPTELVNLNPNGDELIPSKETNQIEGATEMEELLR